MNPEQSQSETSSYQPRLSLLDKDMLRMLRKKLKVIEAPPYQLASDNPHVGEGFRIRTKNPDANIKRDLRDSPYDGEWEVQFRKPDETQTPTLELTLVSSQNGEHYSVTVLTENGERMATSDEIDTVSSAIHLAAVHTAYANQNKSAAYRTATFGERS